MTELSCTSNLLQYLSERAAEATFFVVDSTTANFPVHLQARYNRIGARTPNCSVLMTLPNEAVIVRVGWGEDDNQGPLGTTPNMTRPTHGINQRVITISIVSRASNVS